MPRRVKGPDGRIHQFPDNATDQQISVALKAIPEANKPTPASKVPTWSDRLGLNEPTDSVTTGFLRGAGSGAVDLVQGAVSNVTGQMNAKLDAENAARLAGGFSETATLPRVEQPQTMSGTIGSAAPTVAAMAVPAGSAAKTAYDAIPRAARAAEGFKDVMGSARHIPLDVKDVGNVALRIGELAERGGAMPKAVRDLLKRMTDPAKAPMVYEEGRDFASNISRLSADEYGRLTPVIAREVAELRVALNHANAMAAKAAGKLPEYQAAMKEYAQAMRIRNVITSAIEGAKKSAPYATAAGAAYWLTKKLAGLIDQ